MAYPPKIMAALRVLDAAGVSRSRSAPLVYRWIWSLGIPLRPPPFQSAFSHAAFVIGLYAVVTGAIRFSAGIQERLIRDWAISTVIFAVCVTVWMFVVRRQTRRNLPDWSEIRSVDPTVERPTKRFD
jgi:hypothetical protein